MRDLVDRTVARFGRLDVAVNNAGTEGQPGPVTQQTADTYAATFDTNVLGTLLSMKHELRVMQAQGSGSIVNISSTYGHEGAAGASVYAASKHAVEGMTKSAALEAARFGVRVNAVAPGPTETAMLTRFTGTAGEEGGAGGGRAAGTRRRPGRDCSRHRVPCVRQGVIRDWPGPHRRWRQDRGLNAHKSGWRPRLPSRLPSAERSDSKRRFHVYVERESGTHYRRFAGHWCSDRETSGRGRSERGHHVREGRRRGFRRGQGD